MKEMTTLHKLTPVFTSCVLAIIASACTPNIKVEGVPGYPDLTLHEEAVFENVRAKLASPHAKDRMAALIAYVNYYDLLSQGHIRLFLEEGNRDIETFTKALDRPEIRGLILINASETASDDNAIENLVSLARCYVDNGDVFTSPQTGRDGSSVNARFEISC